MVAQKAQVAISRRQVEHCRVVSPFDGVVTRRAASLGAYVSPGTAVAEIIDTDRVEVTSQVPLGDVGLLATRPLSFRTDNGEYEVTLRTWCR
ncbi:MAG: HlyD family efflux transporter periplasmic adaptor subunit [Gammaproteobacteria bacterium]|nr:HlyD family efflux transporter periplasmic adaptor subunit [Gammaproteobacteria bacterium]